MKKNWFLVMFAMICMGSFVACSDSDDGDGDGGNGTTQKLRIKTVTFEYQWSATDAPGFTEWTYNYDANGRLTKVTERGEDWTEDFVFDWSVAGQVTVQREEESKTKVWMLNNQGYVSKIVNVWGDGGDITMEYNTDGYMIKGYEVYDNTPELKSELTITDGNVMSFTRKRNGAMASKNFTYSTGLNVGGIYQAANDSFCNDWQSHTGLFGKPSKNLVTKVQWSDSEDPTEIQFEFNDDGSVKKVIRAGSDWYENYAYTYEVVE